MSRIHTPAELEAYRQELLSLRDPDKPCITLCSGSACHGFCERGPIIVIHPEEICYFQITPEDVPDCGPCVRYCAEVKGQHAVGFIDRGMRKEISFIPEIAALACWNCKECFELCPTEALQAAYVLTESLVSDRAPFETEPKPKP